MTNDGNPLAVSLSEGLRLPPAITFIFIEANISTIDLSVVVFHGPASFRSGVVVILLCFVFRKTSHLNSTAHRLVSMRIVL